MASNIYQALDDGNEEGGGEEVEGTNKDDRAADNGGSDNEGLEQALDRAALVPAVEAMLALHWMGPGGQGRATGRESGGGGGGGGTGDGAEDIECDGAVEGSSGSGWTPQQQMSGTKLAVLGGQDLVDLEWPIDPAEHIAAENSLPHWFAALLVEQYSTTPAAATDDDADTAAAVSSSISASTSAATHALDSSPVQGVDAAAALAAAFLEPGPVTLRRNRRLCPSQAALIQVRP
jgi:hypothetical protein